MRNGAVGQVVDLDEEAQARGVLDFQLSDLGNAERFVRRYCAELRHVRGWGWLSYDGSRWVPDEQRAEHLAQRSVRSIYTEVANLSDRQDKARLLAHALKSERAERIAALLRLARSMPEVASRAEDFDAEPTWTLLNCENGTVDLRTGRLSPHDHRERITKLAPVSYDPDAQCPTWETFIRWAFRERPELVAYWQRALGYCLTGLSREQVWFLLHGSGGNGKSTALDVLESILGDYVVRAMLDLFFGKASHPTELAALAGSRLAIVSEPELGKPFRAGLLKYVTGERSIPARRINQDPWQFPVTFKIIISANHKPQTLDDSDGFWRRVALVPFDNRIGEAERDPGLREKLLAERVGILAWLVRGSVAYFKSGIGSAPQVTEAVVTYREEQNQIRRFIEDECRLSPDAWVRTAELYEVFHSWCERNGENRPSRQDFTAKLERVDGVLPERRNYGRGFSGIGLAPPRQRAEVTA